MHPNSAQLLAFCDGEANQGQIPWIARHVSECRRCEEEILRIRDEREKLPLGAATGSGVPADGLAGVLTAMRAWREYPSGAAASQLKRRLAAGMELYCGVAAAESVEHAVEPAEASLARSSEVLEAFLGQGEAEAIREEALRGLCWRTGGGNR